SDGRRREGKNPRAGVGGGRPEAHSRGRQVGGSERRRSPAIAAGPFGPACSRSRSAPRLEPFGSGGRGRWEAAGRGAGPDLGGVGPRNPRRPWEDGRRRGGWRGPVGPGGSFSAAEA